jgi:hypothetical protein
VTHHGQKFGLGAIRRVGCLPGLPGFAHGATELLVRQSELVSQFPRFLGLVFQLAGLSLEEMIALFEGGHARSGYLTLAGHSHSANYRVYFRESEWHVRARNSGYSRDDLSYREETGTVRQLAPDALRMS